MYIGICPKFLNQGNAHEFTFMYLNISRIFAHTQQLYIQNHTNANALDTPAHPTSGQRRGSRDNLG